MSDVAVGGVDDSPNSACYSIEDRLTKLAFGRELISPVTVGRK
jgi:hypothetical protein